MGNFSYFYPQLYNYTFANAMPDAEEWYSTKIVADSLHLSFHCSSHLFLHFQQHQLYIITTYNIL